MLMLHFDVYALAPWQAKQLAQNNHQCTSDVHIHLFRLKPQSYRAWRKDNKEAQQEAFQQKLDARRQRRQAKAELLQSTPR